MQFQREDFSGFFDEALPLFKSHFDEVQDYFDGEKDFNPDIETYIKLDECDVLRAYTLRDGDKLVGYCIHHIFRHLHFCNSLQAIQDSIFISKQYRGIGRSFIEWVDDQLSLEGIEAVYHHVSRNHDYSQSLKDLGYNFIETTYLRRLD